MRTQDLHVEAWAAAARRKPDRPATTCRSRVNDCRFAPEAHLVEYSHSIKDLGVVNLVPVLQHSLPHALPRDENRLALVSQPMFLLVFVIAIFAEPE